MRSTVTRRQAVAGAFGSAGAAIAPSPSSAGVAIAPRHVLGFYYGWYGSPWGEGGAWRHWRGPTGVEAPAQKPNTDTPVLGLYDSHDPAVVAQHVRWARAAGLTGLISGGWTPGGWEDRSTALLLDAARREDLVVSAYLERAPAGPASAVEYLSALVAGHARHPAWLRVGDRPVVFLYDSALTAADAGAWRHAAKRVAAMGQPEPFLVADVDTVDGPGFGSRAPFADGVHVYMTTSALAGKDPAGMRDWTRGAFGRLRARAGLQALVCATVMPGFDDSKTAHPEPKVERYGVEALRAQWEGAIAAHPDWVLLTSFNAWNDGSQLEPSRTWGSQALEANRAGAARFKSVPVRRPA